jgi:phosphoglycolate phosphatase-like HAD superfamily hydrolase
MAMDRRLIAFDIDGTLLLSGGAGMRALNRAFYEVTGAPDAMEGVNFFGMTDYAIIREMAEGHLDRPISDAEREEVRRLYAVHLPDELAHSPGFEIMPGVSDLIERLDADERVILGLATGNFEETAMLKLAAGRLDRFFHFGGFGSDSVSRPELTKLAVERGRALAGESLPDDAVFVVGDTVHDVRCGREAGARVIGVATGNTSEVQLQAEEPFAVLPDLTDADRFYSLIGLDGRA